MVLSFKDGNGRAIVCVDALTRIIVAAAMGSALIDTGEVFTLVEAAPPAPESTLS